MGVLAPWTLPFTVTALGIVLNHGRETLSEKIADKFFSEGSYGKQLSQILEKVLKDTLKIGKKRNTLHNYFYNYHVYCSHHYSHVLSFLIDKGINTDIYSDEAIRAVISEEFKYPGRDNPDVIQCVLKTANEIQSRFENKVLEDKNLGLRWLIEKSMAKQNKQISNIIKVIESEYFDDTIDDATYEYIRNFERPLFFDINTRITLGKMYLEPSVKNKDEKAMDAIVDWYDGDEKILIVYGAAGVGKTSLVTKIISDIYGISGNEDLLKLNKEDIRPVILRDHIDKIINLTQISGYSALNVIKNILNISDTNLDGKLIILDGFDELYVLANDMDCKMFITKLKKDLKSHNIKVMITSRPIKEIRNSCYSDGIPYIDIIWTDVQINNWCEKFDQLTDSDEEKKWCEEFMAHYTDVFKKDNGDNRLEMFSIPIILDLLGN